MIGWVQFGLCYAGVVAVVLAVHGPLPGPQSWVGNVVLGIAMLTLPTLPAAIFCEAFFGSSDPGWESS